MKHVMVDRLPTWQDGGLRLEDCVDSVRDNFAAIGLRLWCEEQGLDLNRLTFIRWQVWEGKFNDGDDRYQMRAGYDTEA